MIAWNTESARDSAENKVRVIPMLSYNKHGKR